MFEKLTRFLSALSRLPGFGWAERLRNGLREASYRRIAMKAQVKKRVKMAKNIKDSGADLLALKKGGAVQQSSSSEKSGPTTTMAPESGPPNQTIIMPRPRARMPVRSTDEPASAPPTWTPLTIRGSGLNPLVDAATELFSLVGRLCNTVSQPDAAGLRVHMERKVAEFDHRARAAGLSAEQIVAGRYALCTLLDEVALTTPWGAESLWSRHSLLSQFHNETWGGEKFFVMLDRIIVDPTRHLHLLEFMYLCIALGLQGKYRVLERGAVLLQAVADKLWTAIRSARGEFERELSVRWRGVEEQRGRLLRLVPLWVVGSLAAALLLAAYVGFIWSLARISDPTYRQIAKIGQDARLTAAVAPVDRTLTLREALAQDIQAGSVDVIEQPRGSTVEIRGDAVFASGSTEVDTARIALIQRIGDALDRFPGPVLISGHTDNQPLAGSRRVRFPTNWHLSQARAEAVSVLLAKRLAVATRIAAEGRGETEPKTANDTPEQRARNRRVEITLLNAPAAHSQPRARTTQATSLDRPTSAVAQRPVPAPALPGAGGREPDLLLSRQPRRAGAGTDVGASVDPSHSQERS